MKKSIKICLICLFLAVIMVLIFPQLKKEKEIKINKEFYYTVIANTSFDNIEELQGKCGPLSLSLIFKNAFEGLKDDKEQVVKNTINYKQDEFLGCVIQLTKQEVQELMDNENVDFIYLNGGKDPMKRKVGL